LVRGQWVCEFARKRGEFGGRHSRDWRPASVLFSAPDRRRRRSNFP